MAVIKQRENDLFYKSLVRISDRLFSAILTAVVEKVKKEKLRKISKEFLASLIDQAPGCNLVVTTKKKTIKLEMMIMGIDPETGKTLVQITFPFYGKLKDHHLVIEKMIQRLELKGANTNNGNAGLTVEISLTGENFPVEIKYPGEEVMNGNGQKSYVAAAEKIILR